MHIKYRNLAFFKNTSQGMKLHTRSQPCDRELQRQLCKNLQRNKYRRSFLE
jgi:hypothetical protein